MGRTRLYWISALVALAVAAVALVPLLVSDKDDKKVHPARAESAQRLQMPLHAEGSKIVDARGVTVQFTGVNWFGLETNTFAPHGLWSRKLDDMLDQMVAQGFNSMRLPFSNELFDAASKPNGVDFALNPDLKGLTGPQLMDRVVEGATKRGMMVILDRHRPTSQGQSNLWYTDKVSEDRWISDWVKLAKQYRDNPLVVGADLHNEPHGEATWGDGNEKTDWQAAAQRAGDAVLKANPNWLIVVEGIENYKKADGQNDGYWWGGNLQGAKDHPVKLSDQSKLVYSAHDYSPKVWSQQWFTDPAFPANMPALWDKQFGYLVKNNTAPVLMGEFGGRSVAEQDAQGNKDLEGIWQRNLVKYLKDNGLSYTYWAWNPNSGDTGGVLKDDWTTVDADKAALLKTYQAPLAAAAQ
ncbi:glycoside hydrolase family 5 protein [Dactylosporangium sp. CA-052675]|uniref:glycoside hydrolase family 5 protein n=1 Tax=Dactylosporangium sp. CA-052675 TaxID=3239927 RepID=UPI003D94103B